MGPDVAPGNVRITALGDTARFKHRAVTDSDGVAAARYSVGDWRRIRFGRVFAVVASDRVTMSEHLSQTSCHRPSEEDVDHRAAGQRERQSIGQPATATLILKLVPMDPPREGAPDLFVHEKAVLFKRRVLRHPCHRPNREDHAGARANAAAATDDPNRGEGRRQKSQRVFPFMKCKYRRDPSIDEAALHKCWHTRHVSPMHIAIVTAGTKALKRK